MSVDNLNPNQLQQLDKAVRECVDSLTRADGEKQFRKDVSERIKEDMEIKPADFNQLVKERYDQACSNKIEKLQAIVDLSDKLKSSTNSTS